MIQCRTVPGQLLDRSERLSTFHSAFLPQRRSNYVHDVAMKLTPTQLETAFTVAYVSSFSCWKLPAALALFTGGSGSTSKFRQQARPQQLSDAGNGEKQLQPSIRLLSQSVSGWPAARLAARLITTATLPQHRGLAARGSPGPGSFVPPTVSRLNPPVVQPADLMQNLVPSRCRFLPTRTFFNHLSRH